MARLVCDVCGGNLVVQAGGKFGVCDSCGANYTLDRMREIASGMKVSVTGSKEDVEQWIALMGTYLSAFDYEAAERTVKKILEAEPANQYANELYPRIQEYKYFEIKNAVLVKYHGLSASVEMPHGITTIGRKAFRGNSCIKQTNIPAGVVNIETDAFASSSLESVTIPDSVVHIGDRAFYECNIRSIKLPNSVINIGQNTFDYYVGNATPGSVFKNCKYLESIVLSDHLECIPLLTFYGCKNLTSIVIPNGVSFIGEFAFSGCQNLGSVVIPESVTSIGRGVFSGCTSLKSVRIPGSVTTISGWPQVEKKKYNEPLALIDAWSLKETPYGIKMLKQVVQQQALQRRNEVICQHCGGEFKGIFNKVCSKCGKPKDY